MAEGREYALNYREDKLYLGQRTRQKGIIYLTKTRATLWWTNCQLRLKRSGKPSRLSLHRQWIPPPLNRPPTVFMRYIMPFCHWFNKRFTKRANIIQLLNFVLLIHLFIPELIFDFFFFHSQHQFIQCFFWTLVFKKHRIYFDYYRHFDIVLLRQ